MADKAAGTLEPSGWIGVYLGDTTEGFGGIKYDVLVSDQMDDGVLY